MRLQHINLTVKDVGKLIECSLMVINRGGICVSPVAQLNAEAGKAQGVCATGMMNQANPAQLSEIAALIDGGSKPLVLRVIPLAEALKDHAQLETNHMRAKIVLRLVEG